MGEPVGQHPDMCPNCVTPWKCNGPHLTSGRVTCQCAERAGVPEGEHWALCEYASPVALAIPTVSLDAAWNEVESLLDHRPYPHPDVAYPTQWSLQLHGYTEGPEQLTAERYTAIAMPAFDSHHRNAITATALTPVEALQALAERLR